LTAKKFNQSWHVQLWIFFVISTKNCIENLTLVDVPKHKMKRLQVLRNLKLKFKCNSLSRDMHPLNVISSLAITSVWALEPS